MKNYSKEQWEELIKRFNEMSFKEQLITIRDNPDIFEMESDNSWFMLKVKGIDADDFDPWFGFDPEWHCSSRNLWTIMSMVLNLEE